MNSGAGPSSLYIKATGHVSIRRVETNKRRMYDTNLARSTAPMDEHISLVDLAATGTVPPGSSWVSIKGLDNAPARIFQRWFFP